MAYDGYLRYGGLEVVNTERLAAYVANGLTPTDLRIDVGDTCPGLAEVLAGGAWQPYRTPIQDRPAWVDDADPDTYDFAGLLPLEVTGLDNTTRTVAMTPTVRDGALPGSARRGPRTVGVTAVLVGRTTEGVQAGLSWLRTALHGSCEAAEQDCGPAATLEVFTACAGPISSTANTDVPPQRANYLSPYDSFNPSYDWAATRGSFTTPAEDGTVLVPFQPASYDGGTSTTPVPALPLDGGGADPGDLLVIDGGRAGIFPASALLAGPINVCTDGPVTITWSLRDAAPEASGGGGKPGPGQFPDLAGNIVQLVIVDDSGRAVEFGPKVEVTASMTEFVWELPFGVDHDTWRPGITVTYPVVVESVTTLIYPDSSPLDCVAPYWRFLPNTATVSGPLVVEEIATDCAVLLKVEWTWVVGSPYRYGVTRTVLAGLSAETDPTLVLPGVSWDRLVATNLAVIDNGDTTTGWSAPAPGFVFGGGGGAVYVVSGPGKTLQARRFGEFDVAERRYIAVQWNGESGVPPGGSPSLSVLAPGAVLPVAATLVRNDTLVSGLAWRTVFQLPDLFGDTVASVLWTGTGAPPTGQSTVVAFDRITASNAEVDTGATESAAPWNCGPPAEELSCAFDPGAPGFGTAPALPLVPATTVATITTQQVRSVSVCVGPEQTPANDGVFTIELTASDGPVVGARVRVWDNADGDCTVPEDCAFAYEYLVDFVPDEGVLTIDGVRSSFTTLCDGGNVLADASGVVRGDFGGPTKEPLARCDRRYLILVQWLDTYPRSGGDLYAQGSTQGQLTVSVSVTPREG